MGSMLETNADVLPYCEANAQNTCETSSALGKDQGHAACVLITSKFDVYLKI